jgi:hypothetical protein
MLIFLLGNLIVLENVIHFTLFSVILLSTLLPHAFEGEGGRDKRVVYSYISVI